MAAIEEPGNSNRPRIEIWEPTYRMDPKDGCKFQAHQVEKILKQVMDSTLTGVQYEPDKAKELSIELSATIKKKVKELNFERYKIVVQSTIGEVKDQGARVSSRCLWDDTNDSWASYSFKNATLFAVVTVFGLYFE